MKVADVLNNLKFLSEVVSDVQFKLNSLDGHDVRILNRMPKISEWNGGEIVLKCQNGSAYTPQVKKVLGEFGVADVNIDSNNCITFKATNDSDIISVLAEILKYQRLQQQLGLLRGLKQEVGFLIQQEPNVRHGVGSRGVIAMKKRVQVLNNIVNQKQY